ncbi:hypothetical protein C922_05137 [Plasmodium inui San Antonio 1]|uniref:Uncharacterized protein n=1 Tax=Plasmodium inui San Antonio 1 TaxID=1237626 RepID=W7A5V8_9APIC|nr:hypothetical protein C922_05137 [Plasmodium inui San Antonio 1]EUD64474.1 hypothetical protein C922_05137 [Plasmodium inui San Antonio 1]
MLLKGEVEKVSATYQGRYRSMRRRLRHISLPYGDKVSSERRTPHQLTEEKLANRRQQDG